MSRVGNILRFESPVALEYTLTIFVEVWENKLEGEQPLYAFKKNTGDIINDTTPSEDTVYSSSKVEELLSGVSGSGGSTLYEFSTPLKLNYFIKNYLDENIPYYSDITSLADYITDTNKIAVIIPDTSEANAGQLKYTEVINDGVIRCYFTQELDGYSIKSIEIRNISKEESVIPKIKFRIRDTSATNYSCVAESGMTWSEWCSSEYNTISAVVNGTHIQVSNIEGELKNVSFALPDDEIKNMTYYIF